MQHLYASPPWPLSTPPPSTAHQFGIAEHKHTHLLERGIDDALRMVTGCLKPTPTEYLSVLFGIPPAELRRKAATLLLGRQSSESGHTLYKYMYFNRPMTKRHLKSRKPFFIEAQGLLVQNTNVPT